MLPADRLDRIHRASRRSGKGYELTDSIPDVELVGGGLAEWPSGQGPRGETVAPAAYIDVSGHEALLELPHRFHEATAATWQCTGVWQLDPPALAVQVSGPATASFRIPLVPARHGPLIDAALREGGLYLCPTTPRHGINARLARDHSFFCVVDRGFVEQWKTLRTQR